jgi:hypothetical protein
MNYELQKSGVRKMKEDFLEKFQADLEEAKRLVDGVGMSCQNRFNTHHALEVMRLQIETATKRASFELTKLIVLLNDLTDSETEDFTDIANVLEKNN